MKILITSGGTKAPIDSVRDVTNKSKGRFGAEIAKLCVEAGHEVTFLRAAGSKSPFVWECDQTIENHWATELQRFADHYNWCGKYRGLFQDVRYENFGEYVRNVEYFTPHVDAVVLAAAVSDYSPKYRFGKISSDGPLTIEMSPNAKVISRVRQWSRNPDRLFLVGFKMLVEAGSDALKYAAVESIRKNRCDMVVANDYATLHLDGHKTLVVEPHWLLDTAGRCAWECDSINATEYSKAERAAAVVERLNKHAKRIAERP